jgi:hypothetical protein
MPPTGVAVACSTRAIEESRCFCNPVSGKCHKTDVETAPFVEPITGTCTDIIVTHCTQGEQ